MTMGDKNAFCLILDIYYVTIKSVTYVLQCICITGKILLRFELIQALLRLFRLSHWSSFRPILSSYRIILNIFRVFLAHLAFGSFRFIQTVLSSFRLIKAVQAQLSLFKLIQAILVCLSPFERFYAHLIQTHFNQSNIFSNKLL